VGTLVFKIIKQMATAMSGGSLMLRKLIPERFFSLRETAKELKLDNESVYKVIYDAIRNDPEKNELARGINEVLVDNEVILILAALGKKEILLKFYLMEEFKYDLLLKLLKSSQDVDTFKQFGNLLSAHPEAVHYDLETMYKISIFDPKGITRLLEFDEDKYNHLEGIILDPRPLPTNDYIKERNAKLLRIEFRDMAFMLVAYPQFIELPPSQLLSLSKVRTFLMNYFRENFEDVKKVEERIIGNYVEEGLDLCKRLQTAPGLEVNDVITNYTSGDINKLKLIKRLTDDDLLGFYKYSLFKTELGKRFVVLGYEGVKGDKVAKRTLKDLNKRHLLQSQAYEALLTAIVIRDVNILKQYDEKQLALLHLEQLGNKVQIFEISGYKYLNLMASMKGNDEEITTNIKCRNCTKYTVTYTELQTRGADEPMTIFYHCSACGTRWKG
jgi:DNA-directed RNA polymerase subunit M/transcription elongation factor TFIIS